jgi:hypothetical protein
MLSGLNALIYLTIVVLIMISLTFFVIRKLRLQFLVLRKEYPSLSNTPFFLTLVWPWKLFYTLDLIEYIWFYSPIYFDLERKNLTIDRLNLRHLLRRNNLYITLCFFFFLLSVYLLNYL